MKFRKKPVVVDAVPYEGGMEDGYVLDGAYHPKTGPVPRSMFRKPAINTLEGPMIVNDQGDRAGVRLGAHMIDLDRLRLLAPTDPLAEIALNTELRRRNLPAEWSVCDALPVRCEEREAEPFMGRCEWPLMCSPIPWRCRDSHDPDP